VPEEDRVVKHVLDVLSPFTSSNGGPLVVKQLSYTPGRSNLMVTYPGETEATVAFVGSHMDVVTANAAEWGKDPFKLIVEGDKVFGRGTTDCLGHVAMLTDMLYQLAEAKPKLKRSVVVLFICNEENSSIEGIGVDEVVKRGEIEHLKKGPVFWVDSADEHPCIGTGGVTTWKLTFHGKIGHSGLPHNAINPIIGSYEALTYIMNKFHAAFPAHPDEKRYGYPIPSTMKPTQVLYPEGSLNQIPGVSTISGDIRLTPFYKFADVKKVVDAAVAELNANISQLNGQVNF
jgi:acetylornithine deacetylase